MEDGLGRRTVAEDGQGYELWRTVWDGGRLRRTAEDGQGYELRRTVWDGGRSGL